MATQATKQKRVPAGITTLAVGAFALFYTGIDAQTTFNYTGTLQNYVVPTGVTMVHIDAAGAQGGSVSVSCTHTGGMGARMQGDFSVNPGDTLRIMVGQQGQTNGADAGGGGGTFVVAPGNVPLIVAGGGGGASNNIGSCGSNLDGIDATITTSGTASGNGLVAGGTGGNGGGASSGSGGGGGGFLTDGTAGTGIPGNNGKCYLNGGAGGTGNNNDSGGYGGGGAGWFTGGNGGGGGGYSGGGTSGSQPYTAGGGGGSYNAGTNPNNTAGFETGDGYATITPFPPGAALNFDGVDDQVNLGNTINGVLTSVNTFTVEAWVNPTLLSGLGVIIGSYSNPTNNMQFLLRKDNDQYNFFVDPGSGFVQVGTGPSTVTTGTWQHVAGTWDGDSLRIYLNGTLMGTTPCSGTGMMSTTNNIVLGDDGINESFYGDMDEVRVWTRTLCEDEIQQTMGCEIHTTGNGLLINYNFNQGGAGLNNSSVTTLVDSSGNAFNGTLMNFALNGATSNWVAPGGVTSYVSCSAYTPPAVAVTSGGQTDVSCNGSSDGTASVIASGGMNFTYSWTPGNPSGQGTSGVTGLAAGTYTCMVTNDCGGTGSYSFTITEPAVLTASVTSTTDPTTCSGSDGAINITVSGGTSTYTYSWNNSSTNEDPTGLTAGTYNCMITDANGCTTTASATLTNPNPPVVTLAVSQDTVCQNNAAFTLSGGSPAGGVFSGPGVSSGSFDPGSANAGMNTITYTYTDPTTSCSASATDSIFVSLCTGIHSVSSDVPGFTLMPNPNNGTFGIQLNTNETAEVTIYNAMGQLVSEQQVQPKTLQQFTLTVSGVYRVTVTTANGKRSSKTVVVSK